MVNCLITGRAVYQYFTFKDKHYTFCCTGCLDTLVNKVCNKEPAVKKIIMKSKDVKKFTKVELSSEQIKKLKSSLGSKGSKRSSGKRSSRKSSKGSKGSKGSRKGSRKGSKGKGSKGKRSRKGSKGKGKGSKGKRSRKGSRNMRGVKRLSHK